MRFKSALAGIAIAATLGLAGPAPAEAGWYRGGPPAGWGVVQPVQHWVYYPQYQNVYYMATIAPYPYPLVYLPRGYWERPYYYAPAAYYPGWGYPAGGCYRACGRRHYHRGGYIK